MVDGGTRETGETGGDARFGDKGDAGRGDASGGDSSRGRLVAAVAVSALAAPIGIWAALVAALSLLQQVVAGFFVLGNASWTEFLNPAVWFGWQNVAGTGGILDSLLGGPGAPGGTVSRYATFLLAAMLASGCYAVVAAAWRWARERPA